MALYSWFIEAEQNQRSKRVTKGTRKVTPEYTQRNSQYMWPMAKVHPTEQPPSLIKPTNTSNNALNTPIKSINICSSLTINNHESNA